MFPWLIKHAQFMLNNFALRSDGITPYEWHWSKCYNAPLCKIGEVFLARLPSQRQGRTSVGIALWLGRDIPSNQHFVGCKDRSKRRLPFFVPCAAFGIFCHQSPLKKKQDEPTNPKAKRLPLPRASVNESCQRLWQKLLSMSLVNDSCERPFSTTGQESATC